MPKPTRNMKLRSGRRTAALDKIAKKVSSNANSGIATAAQKFLADKLMCREMRDARASRVLELLMSTPKSHDLIRVSREKYLECLDLAYAAVAIVENAGVEKRRKLIDTLCKNVGAKTIVNINVRSLVLRALIDYGIDKNGKPLAGARRLWSRDAKALEYLDSKGVPVGGVVEYQKTHKGGLDEWSRRAASHNKKPAAASINSSKESCDEVEEPRNNSLLPNMDKVVKMIIDFQTDAKNSQSVVLLLTCRKGVLDFQCTQRRKLKKNLAESLVWAKIQELMQVSPSRKSKKASSVGRANH